MTFVTRSPNSSAARLTSSMTRACFTTVANDASPFPLPHAYFKLRLDEGVIRRASSFSSSTIAKQDLVAEMNETIHHGGSNFSRKSSSLR
jgi:hypothetical protein